MPESRSYVVGLPVIVTVWEDGTVEYEIDKSEVTSAMWEDDHAIENYKVEDIIRDEQAIDRSLGF